MQGNAQEEHRGKIQIIQIEAEKRRKKGKTQSKHRKVMHNVPRVFPQYSGEPSKRKLFAIPQNPKSFVSKEDFEKSSALRLSSCFRVVLGNCLEVFQETLREASREASGEVFREILAEKSFPETVLAKCSQRKISSKSLPKSLVTDRLPESHKSHRLRQTTFADSFAIHSSLLLFGLLP